MYTECLLCVSVCNKYGKETAQREVDRKYHHERLWLRAATATTVHHALFNKSVDAISRFDYVIRRFVDQVVLLDNCECVYSPGTCMFILIMYINLSVKCMCVHKDTRTHTDN